MEGFRALLLAEYTPAQWALVFFLYGFAGWCWEVSLYLVKERRFVNRGFLTGPILPIYGFGALIILLSCVPVKGNPALVALLGTLSATLLELATGAVMEALFHVRYWDYTGAFLNFKGYVCLKSSLVWAAFSVMIVCGVHPLARDVVLRVPATLCTALSAAFVALALADTVASVRRAIDLRKLLESMERYAHELEALHATLDSVGERMGEKARAFAQSLDAKGAERTARFSRLSAARERIARELAEKRITLEEAARERFAALERAFGDRADLAPEDSAPDDSALRAEIARLRERYERQSAAMRKAREERISRARQVLQRNPGAVSRRHSASLDALRSEEKRG